MRQIKVKRFGCDYCRKTMSRAIGMKEHEKMCFANPAKRACKSCKHDIKEKCVDGDCYCDVDGPRPYSNGVITCRYDCPLWEAKK